MTGLLLFSLSACGYDPCIGLTESVNGNTIACGEGGDEAGSEECGLVAWEDGLVIASHGECSPRVQAVLGNESIGVPFTTSLTWEECGVIPESERWDCWTIEELIDNPLTPPMRCGFCPLLTGESHDPNLCWRDPQAWEPDTLQGVMTMDTCDSIDPPIGEEFGYPLSLTCPAGEACLYGSEGCSCKCRAPNGTDIGYVSLDDFIAQWWPGGVKLLPQLPAQYDYAGGYPEVLCYEEPMVWVGGGGPAPFWGGSTIGLDSPEPQFPPNGADHHTPAWELLSGLAGSADTELRVSNELAAAILQRPTEALWGAHAVASTRVLPAPRGTIDVLEIDYCSTGSLCELAGFNVGDAFIGAGPGALGGVDLFWIDSEGDDRTTRIAVGGL